MNIHIHIDHGIDLDTEILRRLDRLEQLITQQGAQMAANFTAIEAALKAENDVESGVETLLAALTAEIKSIMASNTDTETQARLDQLTIDIKAHTDALSAAVVLNTPGAITPPPSSLTLVPRSGNDGTTVVCTGTGFGATQGSGIVTFGGKNADVLSWSDTSITVTVPSGSSGQSNSGVSVVVQPAVGAAQSAPFTVTPNP